MLKVNNENYPVTENLRLLNFIEELCDQNRILENRNKQLTKKVNELQQVIELLERDKEEIIEELEIQISINTNNIKQLQEEKDDWKDTTKTYYTTIQELREK